MKPHRGTLILILGIVGFCCGIVGLVAFIMGTGDLKEMREGRMDPSGEGKTQVGRWLGLVFFILNVVGIILQYTVFKGAIPGQ
jgi:hypothetical protein